MQFLRLSVSVCSKYCRESIVFMRQWVRILFQKLVLVTFPTTWNISYHIDSWKFVVFFSLSLSILFKHSIFDRRKVHLFVLIFKSRFQHRNVASEFFDFFWKKFAFDFISVAAGLFCHKQLNSSAWPHNWNNLSKFRGENGARVNDLRLSTNWTFTHFNH